ncbi:N-acetyltransferase ESCO, acetyl-transferase domain,Acyl-CoA N-acyltransferase [Cinara cedri]|uniref:N-acetyltransferase ESCO, acetyl-transferase domain,Acyl-CoA N-acyltransferase n=1 Tax=Cinara cedri TaxID=506608 RepID=A0A5E4MGD9_9HEMI|nr:N-acetyltransferase ESCO, acetyl-transferase domain,Acyl-CoA N-acyltransferase [Cinara cedri]
MDSPLAASTPLQQDSVKRKTSKCIIKSKKSLQDSKSNTLNTTTINSFPELFQLELSLKMFPEIITPYLNSLSREALILMNNCKYSISKNVQKTIQHIQNQLESSMDTPIYTTIVNKTYPTIPFIKVDLDYLNILNSKYAKTDKILKLLKLSLNDNIPDNSLDNSMSLSMNSEISSIIRTEEPGSFYYTGELYKSNTSILSNNSFNSLNNSVSLHRSSKEHCLENCSEISSIIRTEEAGTYEYTGELYKSNTSIFFNIPLNSLNNSVSLDRSSKEQYLENYNSLREYANDPSEDISQIVTPVIHSFDDRFNIEKLPSINKSSPNDFSLENYSDCKQVEAEKDQKRYWLRHRPKATDHFFIPYKPIQNKKKICQNKTNYNDVIINQGKGKKKVTLKYKFHSVINNNSCLENNTGFNKNNTISNISINPRKTDKPCRCGIYPSQVPSSWSSVMHETVHQNLYKLQFKSQINIEYDVLSKVNDNGFLYDIIKITKDNNNDRNLNSLLKNIQDFIDLELDFSNKKLNSKNHSIFLAVNPNSKIIGYLEIDFLENACIYQNNRLSNNLTTVKFGVSKIWVMVKYRNKGVATNLLKQFQDEANVNANNIAFAYLGSHGIPFIKKYYGNNSILIY